jgi:hypothetical protein
MIPPAEPVGGQSMPQLDFREALSTPDEKLFVYSPVAATPALAPSPKH